MSKEIVAKSNFTWKLFWFVLLSAAALSGLGWYGERVARAGAAARQNERSLVARALPLASAPKSVAAAAGAVATLQWAAASSSFAENAGMVNVVLKVTNGSGTLSNNLTINPATASGTTATRNSDYTDAPFTIPAGTNLSTNPTFNIPYTIIDDRSVEGAELLKISLSFSSGGGDTISFGAQTVHDLTITDNDTATVAFTAATSSLSEATLTHTVNVGLTINATGTTGTTQLDRNVTVAVSDTPGTASSGGVDYSLFTPSVTFTAGAADGSTAPINSLVVNDNRLEGNETFTLNLGTLTDGTGGKVSLGSQTSHVHTISDNETAVWRFNPTTGSVNEGNTTTNAVVELAVSASGVGAIVVDRSTSVQVNNLGTGTATSGTDYSFTNATATVNGGSLGSLFTFNIPISVFADALAEGDETVVLGLQSLSDGTNGQITVPTSTNSFTLTINNIEAQSLIVTTTGDIVNNRDEQTSLREAIAYGNSFNDAQNRTITFNIPTSDPGYNAGTGRYTIALTSGELVISKNLTIQGLGADKLTVQRSTAQDTPDFRIFNVNSGVTATIDALTVTNGKLSSNTGTNKGAGIYNVGTLTLTNSAISGNTCGGRGAYGGGILNGGTMSIINSTVSGNSGSSPGQNFGGGIANEGGALKVINSTISGNFITGTSINYGGGIYANSGATVSLINSTLTANSANTGAGNGGGVFPDSGSIVSSRNTIIAGNSVNSGGPDFFGTLSSDGFNLIGNTANTTITGTTTGNILNVNALLAPLGNYGGPTQTHALLPGSPAINAGNNALAVDQNNQTLTTDQRGFNRQVGGTVDIGAFESRGFTAIISGGNNQSAALATAFANPLAVTISSSFGEPVQGGAVTFSAPGSGASATLTGSPVTMGANGQVSVTAMANSVAGSYQVTATANGLTPVTFNLTNTCPSFTIGIPTATGALGTNYNSSAAASPAPAQGFSYQYSLVNNTSLPAGLLLNPSTGAITGTPTAPGQVSFTIKAELFNGATTTGCAVTQAFSINITCTNNPVVQNGNDNGAGSLREAIALACPGSTITFASNISTVTLTSAELLINKNLTIQGPGADKLTVQRSTAQGTPDFRIFNISGGVTAALNNLTIANGKVSAAPRFGGGIYNDGSLTLTNSILSGNTVAARNGGGDNSGWGGGIFNSGTLTITNSTLSGNTVAAIGDGGSQNSCIGGGIFNIGSLTLTNSTLSGNSAAASGGDGSIANDSFGGGIANYVSLTLTNSTLSGNAASASGASTISKGNGGGIYNIGSLTLTNSTLSGNTASASGGSSINRSYGGGILNSSTLKARNTLIAGNSVTATDAKGPDVQGTVTSLGNNLIGQTDDSSGWVASDQTGTAANPLDPKLGPLQNNGGPTQTHAPLPGSPAINAGNNCILTNNCTSDNLGFNLTTDQRGTGFNRQVGSAVDIGAFEANYALAATGGNNQTATVNTAFANALTATLTESGTPVSGVALTFTANPAGNGASATIGAPNPAATNGSGQAGVTATANVTAGDYTVTAGAPGGLTASFNLSNTCPPISLAPLPQASAGVLFSAALAASPAGGNYQFSSANLPAWLSLAPNGGLTGTPPAPGNYAFNVLVTGFGGACSQSLPVSLTVTCPTITPGPVSLPAASINTAYSQSITATPVGSYSFAVTGGILPAGLALNSNGSFSGAPTQAGTFNFRVTATGFGGCTGFRDYTLVVNCTAITLDATPLPAGTVGTAYNQTRAASPAGAYSYAVTGGVLPAGLALNAANGAISGTPTLSGTFNFTITAAAGSCTASQAYTLTIGCAAITLTPAALTAGQAGTAYSQTLSASPSGGYNFSLAAGNLPSGLNLNATTGTISGTALVAGTYSFTIKAQAASGCGGAQNYTLTIACPAVTLSALTTPSLNSPYSQTVIASPSGTTYGFALTAGALPAGLSLNPATGLISGTPTTSGAYNFTLTATGFGACAGSRTYTGNIAGTNCQAITLPDITASSAVGSVYTESVAASPAGAYTYVLTGSLPTGVNFYDTAGLLFGYPMSAGDYSFTIKATDASGCTASRTYGVTISAAALPTRAANDFDGDGKSDLAIWRGASSDWLIVRSGDNQLQSVKWGASYDPYLDVTVAADYDGDGITDIAVFRRGGNSAGHWYIRQSADGKVSDVYWGLGSDVPVPADYDGDGKADIAVWRGAEGNWYIKRSSDGQTDVIYWGSSAAAYRDVPLPADYDGDGKADVAVFRRATGCWYIKRSSDGVVLEKHWGLGSDVPVPADYDGDGKADIGVWRGSEGTWYVIKSSTGEGQTVNWGAEGDVPVVADYDGDGKADAAVWQPATGAWRIRRSSGGQPMSSVHGRSSDLPVTARRN